MAKLTWIKNSIPTAIVTPMARPMANIEQINPTKSKWTTGSFV